MKNILLVDDHAIVRRGLIQVLQDENADYHCYEAENGADAMRVLREEDIHVILLDIAMPGRRGKGKRKTEIPRLIH